MPQYYKATSHFISTWGITYSLCIGGNLSMSPPKSTRISARYALSADSGSTQRAWRGREGGQRLSHPWVGRWLPTRLVDGHRFARSGSYGIVVPLNLVDNIYEVSLCRLTTSVINCPVCPIKRCGN